MGICKTRSTVEFPSLGIIVLDQYSTVADGENPLQYFCKVLPINYLIHRRKLLYWNKLFTSDNSVLFSLSRLVSQRFVAFGCLYGLSSTHVSRQTVKQAVWDTFSNTVE